MGKSKDIGGLGFRDFENFNIALLAKQGWRILLYPNSLSSRVLKLKYFSKSDFLEAKMGSNPSYIWRSILSARELLQQGLQWRIGNWKSVRIWSDPWLPQPTSYKPQSGNKSLGKKLKWKH
ncbi:hypothetical protein F2P56_001484 [Juglans regia]|uniref:Uncharacterized protein n=2 Tax=Juglans regia TaxID=51240 RepID=A0A834D8K4_JUGRE|nr:uncharacterized mitochondrial protein AtMg00310-like [Juglans regia]KAF5480768.1 hypothetical protein F2P56_001484 [Juglans regia]